MYVVMFGAAKTTRTFVAEYLVVGFKHFLHIVFGISVEMTKYACCNCYCFCCYCLIVGIFIL